MGVRPEVRYGEGATAPHLPDFRGDREVSGRQDQVRGRRPLSQVRGAVLTGTVHEGSQTRRVPAEDWHHRRGPAQGTRLVLDYRMPDEVFGIHARDQEFAAPGEHTDEVLREIGYS